ncbi:MAG: deoxyguanosinetriphosphate triphosphohydrolase [Deltaproteobacteria bacterium]|nr:deoxyguanosinetriphosphate triphosphohydrolase [Deltaproteobacteria bacterium]
MPDDRHNEATHAFAPFALTSAESSGRVYPQAPHAYRSAFARDRDRVVHSTAFRRLQYKTQVFVHLEGDHYRNRLTHTLEGAQITRTITRELGLNQDLAESVALAHDLGHTPFGHAGERALAEMMQSHGGFDHNRQGLRVVDLLERRHPDYPGLNLTDETREGMLKHGCHWEHPVRIPDLTGQRSAEAQVADASDEIAYLNHDLDDALRAGLIHFDMLMELPLVGPLVGESIQRGKDASQEVRRTQLVASTIDLLVTDLIHQTRSEIALKKPNSPKAVRALSEKIVKFSPEVEEARREIKAFLFERFYNHPDVLARTERSEQIVEGLFCFFCELPQRLPEPVQHRFDESGQERAIADYVAGMTDRFAISEHVRLLGPRPDLTL